MNQLLSAKAFQTRIYNYCKNHPRKELMPWREDPNPYFVLLSEIMLQQTQVNRVIDYFNVFVEKWETITELANAELSEVLYYWQGLGYNRRAKFLHNCAKEISESFSGIIPNDEQVLKTLPGIGDYTSAAIMAFAFNKPSIVLDTNIRRVIIHHFFHNETNVSDTQVRTILEEVNDKENPRLWNLSLMDYGANLSKGITNPNKKSRNYRKQGSFEGSNRQIRGAIIRTMLKYSQGINRTTLTTALIEELNTSSFKDNLEISINAQISQLQTEGMIVAEKNVLYIGS